MGEYSLNDMFTDLMSAAIKEAGDDEEKRRIIVAGIGAVFSALGDLNRIADALEKANEPLELVGASETGLAGHLHFRIKSILAVIGAPPIHELIKKEFDGVKIKDMSPPVRAELFGRLDKMVDAKLAQA